MKLTLTEFVTLDGVCQGPGGPTEDRSGDFQHDGDAVIWTAGEVKGRSAGGWKRGSPTSRW